MLLFCGMLSVGWTPGLWTKPCMFAQTEGGGGSSYLLYMKQQADGCLQLTDRCNDETSWSVFMNPFTLVLISPFNSPQARESKLMAFYEVGRQTKGSHEGQS